MLLRAHKIRLKPTSSQVAYFVRCAGTARYAYNWSLAYADACYREHRKTISDFDLKKVWNAHRKESLPWTYEVTKHAAESGVRNFCTARANWFHDLKQRKKDPKRFHRPRLKTKHRSKKSFTVHGCGKDFRVEAARLSVPKLGTVKMMESVRFPGKIKFVTISEQGGQWFASFQIELSEDYVYPHRCETQTTIGIDVGLHTHFALSTGEKLGNPKLYRRFERKLARAHRALSRKKKGSRNRCKARQDLRDVYGQLGNLRSNHLHQMTSQIVKPYRYIGIEDLNVAGMMKNHSLARALSDASFGEIRRQLQYKAEWAGGHVAVADRFFPSSKLCSACSYKNTELKLKDRVWTCPQCGTVHDRDINAARNLEQVARGLRDTLNACVIGSSATGKTEVVDVSLGIREDLRAVGADSGMCSQSSAKAGDL